jgi:peptidoglycan/xylan/chitin deacetylase (PgdA/CDA1 family)
VNTPITLTSPTSFIPATPESRETETKPSPTSEPTPPFPESFTSDILRAGIEPVTYIQDSCSYLSDRWNPAGSLPGTVVAPVMFHSILKGNGTNDDPSAINFVQFQEIIRQAEKLDFETITTEQLLAFLQKNAKIPARSMILILDDRKPGTAEDYFLPVNEEHNWTTTLAWIAESDTASRHGRRAGESLWDWIERINDTGFFDVQSHGKDHIYLKEGMSEETVRAEIEGSIPFLKEHFGTTPIAYIWPGGNYTALGIQVAHEAGLELGFTVFSRGPLQFNWIPQGEDERSYNDPLMLLPRFWDTAAVLNFEQTAQIGDAAQEFAKENHAAEAAWFSQNCRGELPPLEEIFK